MIYVFQRAIAQQGAPLLLIKPWTMWQQHAQRYQLAVAVVVYDRCHRHRLVDASRARAHLDLSEPRAPLYVRRLSDAGSAVEHVAIRYCQRAKTTWARVT